MEIIQPSETRVTLPPLLTKEQLAANSKGAISVNDPRIDEVLAGASDAVRRYCRWHVTPVVKETLVMNLDGGRYVTLPSLHVVNVHSVKLFDVELDEDEYGWSESGMLELLRPPIPTRFRALTVELTHGYHEADSVSAIASKIGLFSLASPLGVTREQAGQISVSWGTQRGMGFTEHDKTILNAYRVHPGP